MLIAAHTVRFDVGARVEELLELLVRQTGHHGCHLSLGTSPATSLRRSASWTRSFEGVLVVQTDNGGEFQSRFHWHLESHDIRHVYIKPRTPHLNGKVERSHRVDEQEFYQLLDKDGIADDIHLFNDKLREWEDYYNYHRPHGALDGQTPYERLMAKSAASLSTKS